MTDEDLYLSQGSQLATPISQPTLLLCCCCSSKSISHFKNQTTNQNHYLLFSYIRELEACVSELRADVVSKRCHVNMSEVEALALKLSKATRCAADLKSKFPQLSREVKAVSQGEVDNVIKQQE